MGADGWEYFTPYQSDPSEALFKLQKSVFDRGDHLDHWAVDSSDPPTTIEELLIACAEEGTGSILDMDAGIAGAEVDWVKWTGRDFPYSADYHGPLYGSVSPVPVSVLEHAFGTSKPTRALLEANERVWMTEIDQATGLGNLIVVYDGEGRPSEYFFFGFSGD